jgi:ferredoxin
MNYYIIYISPAGTTRHVAEVMGDELARLGKQHHRIDLGCRRSRDTLQDVLNDSCGQACLCIGSPVYASHAVPAVMECIRNLPQGQGCCSVPFVTWGAVTSGLALAEMAELLAARGYPPVAAAKVIAAHSLLWQFEKQLGKGRPDSSDDAQIRNMLRAVVSAHAAGSAPSLKPGALRYQPEALQTIMLGLELRAVRKVLPPIQVLRERCTLCGACAAACPVEALEIVEEPVFRDSCIACYSCLRACPERAMTADFTPLEAGLAQRKKDFGEVGETVVYLP